MTPQGITLASLQGELVASLKKERQQFEQILAQVSHILPVEDRVFSAASPFLKMPRYYASQWMGRGDMFCISVDLKFYQGIKGCISALTRSFSATALVTVT
jgi:hypothetical protein